MILWKMSASVLLVVWPYTSCTYRLYGSVRRYEVSTLRSNWSNNIDWLYLSIPYISSNNIDWLYLSIPYISDTVDHKIRNMFKREGLHVRIACKSTTLRQILQKKKEPPTCNRQNCATSADHICFNKNVVYKITCNKCHLFYIGSPVRNLPDRVHEHLSKQVSSVFKHLAACHMRSHYRQGHRPNQSTSQRSLSYQQTKAANQFSRRKQ